MATDDKARAGSRSVEEGSRAMHFFLSSAFDERVSSLIAEWHVPGMSLSLIHDQTIKSKAFGWHTLHPPTRCTPDTLFDLASVSKSTTAAAVALLIEDDEGFPNVQWDTPVHNVLEDFVLSKDDYTRMVTIEDILSHRSGFPSHDNSYFGIKSSQPDTPGSITRNLRNLPISEGLRVKEQYCNIMFTVASYLVEKLSGENFGDFLRNRIWNPLGMNSTNLQPDSARSAGFGSRMSKPYIWKQDEKEYRLLEYEQTPEAQGAGSIWTSSKDYALWVKALMNQEAPITESIYNGLLKPRIISNPDDDDLDPYTSFQMYSAGLETYFYRGHQIVQHDGLISGYSSVHFWVPSFKVGGVFIGNSENAGSIGSGVLLKEILDELFEVPTSERPDWNARQAKSEADYKGKQKESAEKLRKELSTNDDGIAEVQKIPLSVYTGRYWNVGYRGLEVSVKNKQLFIDASDRTMAFTLELEHISGQTHFIATMYDPLADYEEADKLKVEFKFDGSSNTVVKIGIDLESDLDGELIWFGKVDETTDSVSQKAAVR